MSGPLLTYLILQDDPLEILIESEKIPTQNISIEVQDGMYLIVFDDNQLIGALNIELFNSSPALLQPITLFFTNKIEQDNTEIKYVVIFQLH